MDFLKKYPYIRYLLEKMDNTKDGVTFVSVAYKCSVVDLIRYLQIRVVDFSEVEPDFEHFEEGLRRSVQ